MPPRARGCRTGLDASAQLPLVRMTPPSEPTKNWSGLPGTKTAACWSGCIDSPPTSPVTSVQVAPASCDIRTARPLPAHATRGCVRLQLLVVHEAADDDHVGPVGGRDGEHVVRALRADERRVAVVVDGEARAFPPSGSRAASRRRSSSRSASPPAGSHRPCGRPERRSAAAARVGEVDARLAVREAHRRERVAATVPGEDRLPAACRATGRASGSGRPAACAA